MKNLIHFTVILFLFTQTSGVRAAEKRTDGPAGSEYADFGSFEGDFSFGTQFGALLSTRSSSNSSFSVGADVDYRPYDLFGFRLTYLQGFESPKTSLFTLSPLLHSKISNFQPYIFGGPGVAIVNVSKTKAKFVVSLGLGADIDLTRHFGIGMLWTFHSLLDSADAHALTARLSYKF